MNARNGALIPEIIDHVTSEQKAEAEEYRFFRFIPEAPGSVVPGGPTLHWDGPCFKGNSASAVQKSPGSYEITFNFGNASEFTCSELLLLGTVGQLSVHEFVFAGRRTLNWTLAANASDALLWDAETKGIRVFVMPDGVEQTLASITATAELFEPILTKPVAEAAAKVNLEFMERYAQRKMVRRNVTDVILPESEIHSGDFLGVIRLDGLDPMLSWAMGSTTGHTTVAMWEGGQLYVCESTSNGSYWDVNGIQRTPYRDWISAAKAASYSVVHLPLAQKYRDMFNETLAWQFFNNVVGFDYGYYNMLWGWVDTLQDNYPCLPPDYTRCLSFGIIEVAFPFISTYIHQFEMFYDQAWNKRLNTAGLDFATVLKTAHDRGIPEASLPVIVEQDQWMYVTTRYFRPAVGPSMVCCAFVCHIWKAAGLFAEIDEEINCNELTNWDDYSLLMFNTSSRAQMCVDADPNNTLCQLLGEYTLELNDVNTKLAYPHIAEKCPSLGPDYKKPDNC
eukprot:c25234_g1_i1.p1 GENE.c25234_g1_i1~~c25234_g1_i1.p1  ORF type:complete len:589 (+),score=131.40 c25234_g1_i1:251-1768(+)